MTIILLFNSRSTGKNLAHNFQRMILKLIDSTRVLFLRVILDGQSSWKSQILNITGKVSQSVGNIHKSSFCLNKELLMHSLLQLSFIFRLLCECLGLNSSVNLKRLITPQERVVRIFYQEYTKFFFVNLRMVKFEDIIKLSILTKYKKHVLTVTFIHATLDVRIRSACPTAGQMQGNFTCVLKYLIPLALQFRTQCLQYCYVRDLKT